MGVLGDIWKARAYEESAGDFQYLLLVREEFGEAAFVGLDLHNGKEYLGIFYEDEHHAFLA